MRSRELEIARIGFRQWVKGFGESDRDVRFLIMTDAVETFQALKVLSVSVAILDASGHIVSVNDTWNDFGRQNGLRLPNFGIGVNYTLIHR